MADGITIRAENLQFDGREFSKTMNRQLQDLFVEATRAFLIASTRRIPIRTGFLRGAFTRLEDVVGAFEASGSVKAKIAKARSGARSGKDLASTANRLVRLRQRQNRLLKQIRKLQQQEARRREELNKKLSELQQGNKFLQDKKVRAVLAATRARAIRQRAIVQSLIKQAQANESDIRRAVQKFREKIGGTLRSEANDITRGMRLRDVVMQQKRNEAFQKDIRRLNQAFFGKKTTTPGRFAGRIPGQLDQQTFDARLKRLREKISQPTRTQRNLRKRIKDIETNFITDRQKSMLESYTRKIATKYRERIEEARRRDNQELEDDLIKEAQRKLQRARKKVINTNKEDHPLLAAAQRRLARSERLSSQQVEHLRQLLQGEHQNVVARTTRGRIVGQNTPGKFNLQGDERVKKIFNIRDKNGNLVNGRQEFYYPLRGTPEARILKTPRAGRRFATPSNQIIQIINDPPNPNLVVFQQLAGFVKASGGTVKSDVQRILRDTGDTNTRYQFHFAVDISYLSVNDSKLAWESWQAGINAFNQVIVTKATASLPKLSQFQYVVTRQLRPGQSMTISGRK